MPDRIGLILATAAGLLLLATMLPAARGQAEAPESLRDLRPPAVPLIACDPYFSVWSPHDRLTDGDTTHWTGRPHRMTSLARVDGKTFRLMGDGDEAAMEQAGLIVWPTRTVYTFEGGGVRLSLEFMTPLLPDDLAVASRPLTYLTWRAESTDGAAHDVQIYFDASSELAVNELDQEVTWNRADVDGLNAMKVGTVAQPVLETAGDDHRIDWGYFYVAAGDDQSTIAMTNAAEARASFATGDELPKDDGREQAAAEDAPGLAVRFDLGEVTEDAVTRTAMVAYDDVVSIQFFYDQLRPYWRKDLADGVALLEAGRDDFLNLRERCVAFDRELVSDLETVGGASYAQLGVLSYRQALAAQKLCVDANGQPIMMSKENNSNGCIATVDVLYPAAPQMLVFAPSLLKASLLPLMQYSATELWPHDSAPHDLGTYPLATGQVYGGNTSAMPVEESGNMLILMAALSMAEGDADFADEHWETLTEWCEFLVREGLDPENQLSTDDFAGHLARNANLSIKAIMGIASYGRLCEMTGRDAEGERAFAIARDYAKQWMQLADDGDHYVLAFGSPGTWSQKYNLVWDDLLDLNVFPDEVEDAEHAYYRGVMNEYGLPLDSREAYTKLDWEVWTATLANDPADFQRIVDACAKWANTTPDRVPLSDWYWTDSGRQRGFKARSVVGGNFIALMRDREIWKKYAARDTLDAGGWAGIDIEGPELTHYSPTADREESTWRYTTSTPSDGWTDADFDDADWQQGPAGFGTPGTPAAIVGTRWDTSDIYLRTSFDLPADAELNNPHFWLAHDEAIEVYLNGVPALERRGFRNPYALYRMRPDAAATLKPGRNVIAVHCNQTNGGQYVDVGVVDVADEK